MSEDKIAEIRARHEAGRAKYSCYPLGEVIEQLDYLHSLEQLHDKDDGWGTQLTNVVWYAQDLIESSPGSPSVAPKIWDAFIIGDFDTTLHVATDGARDHLKDAISDRATLLAEVDRLRGALGLRDALRHAAEQDEIERLRETSERLRAALKNIAALDPDVPDALVADALRGIVAQMGEIARKALEGKP